MKSLVLVSIFISNSYIMHYKKNMSSVMLHFDICNSIYYILIVFYVDVFVHIYQQVDQQKQYLKIWKETIKKNKRNKNKKKKKTIIDQLEIMLENIKNPKSNKAQEEEEADQ